MRQLGKLSYEVEIFANDLRLLELKKAEAANHRNAVKSQVSSALYLVWVVKDCEFWLAWVVKLNIEVVIASHVSKFFLSMISRICPAVLSAPSNWVLVYLGGAKQLALPKCEALRELSN